ncbi:rhodanese-like domain-containing protein [Oscillatoria amoena NRMC-F 0135]|nr:rhodanese-like domain-containing protein [Oscillatoria amoena NRMC-F 0135]
MKTHVVRPIANLPGLVLLIIFSHCQGQSGAQVLTPQAYETRLNSLVNKIILDVRTSQEYSKGRIKDAILMDYYQRDFNARLATLDKNKPVFVYCASGVRSNSTAKKLIRQGFKEVYDLSGGLDAWVQSGKPIEK